ncbi:MAG: tetratricopeptide repeat protein [Symploca sp. SIO1B1]|nr:tetratricopeptide repeat protein [Symploca sp. SIO1B1]
MPTSEFGSLLDQYRREIIHLQTNPTYPDNYVTLEDVLRVLNLRESIHQHLTQNFNYPGSSICELLKLDEQLQAAADTINTILESNKTTLNQVRESSPHLSNEWWWHLEKYTTTTLHPWDRYDNQWKNLAVTCWLLNIILVVIIIVRLFSAGADIFGAIAGAISGSLGFPKSRNSIYEKIKGIFQGFPGIENTPSYLEAEVQLILSFVVSLALWMMWGFGFPFISGIYNFLGFRAYQGNNLISAEQDYKRAIKLNPKNKLAYYNLGNLYEDLKETKKAESAYLVAVRSQKFTRAYNNLGRLYILKKDYSSAIAFLSRGVEQVQSQSEAATIDAKVEYALYKNLGWLELEEDNAEFALKHIEKALDIANQAEEDINSGAAHCVMAQIDTKMDKESQAGYHWEQCCEQASLDKPEEYKWLTKAREYLTKEKKKCSAFLNGV